MTHINHSPEQMRTHAREVVRKDFVAMPQPERDKLEVEYKSEWMSISDNASIEANKLRLAIYANLLDVDLVATRIDESAWILGNIEATQILINTIQPGALVEDGDFGPATQRCVQKLFGITIPMTNSRPAPSVTWAISATTAAAFSSKDILEMRRTILSDTHLKGELEKMWVRFIKKEDGEVEMVLPKGFENTVEYRQLQTYIKALHMTTDPEYTQSSISDAQRTEKMNMFLEITRGSGAQILGREYLWYKLINSINEDLKKDPKGPFIMTRSGQQGEYGIFVVPISRDDKNNVTTAPARADLPYHKLLEAGTIDDDYIDFAITYSLIEHNHLAFKGKDFLGQWTLVKTILDKHGITGVSEEDIQNGNLLLADWDIVIDDINKKLSALSTGNSQNVDAYQELLYVKDLIEGKGWMSQQRNTAIFREVNTFWRAFLALEWKALIDDRVGLLNWGAVKEETPGEMIRNMIKENIFGLPGVLALFIAIFNIWGLGKAAGMWLLWAAFGMAGGSIIDSIGKRVPTLNNADELEIVRIRQLQYGIKWGTAVNAVLAKLYSENDNRNEKRRTTTNKDLFVQEPLVLGKILFEVSESNELSTLDLKDNDLATKIYTQMQKDGKLSIRGDEFTSQVSKNPTITQEDVNAFVEILKSQNDTTDTTLWDLLIAGDIDKLNHDYDSSWFDMTEYGEVNTQMHDIFRTAWAPADREERKAILALIESSDALLFAGKIDAASDAWTQSAGIISGVTWVLADGTWVTAAEKIRKIWDLKIKISSSTVSAWTKTSLDTLLGEYENILRKEESFNTLRTTWYSNPEQAIKFANYTEWLNGIPETKVSLENIQTKVQWNIDDLESLKTGLTGTIYTELLAEIDKEIVYLKGVQREITQKLVDLADFNVVTSGSGIDISTPIWLAQVTKVAGNLNDELKKSIATWTTDLFWALNSDVRQAIIIAYKDAANTAGKTWDISIQTWAALWNSIHSGIASTLWSFPWIGGILQNAVSSYIPSPIDPLTLKATVLDSRTLDDIEAQVKLALIKAYLEKTQATIHNSQKLVDMYTGKLPTSIPLWAGDTPEQAELRAILGTQHDDILKDIQTQITTFAQSYKWSTVAGNISTLTVSTTAISLDAYEDAAKFIANATDMDTQINDIKNLITRTFPTTPQFLDTILVDVITLKASLDTKKLALKNAIDTDPIINLSRIWSLTTTEVWNDTSPGTIKWDIFTLKRVQDILWIWTSPLIDAAIPALEARLLEVATVNQIPQVRTAIDTDIASLTGSISTLQGINSVTGGKNRTPAEDSELLERTKLLNVLQTAKNTNQKIIDIKANLQYNDGTMTRNFNTSYYTLHTHI